VDRRPVTLLLAAATFVLGAPTLVRLIGDHGWKWFVLAAVTVPLLVLPLFVLGVAQFLLRRRAMALLTAVLLALNVAWLVPLYVADTAQNGEVLTVLTANLRFGQADAAAVVRMVRDDHVDVLATEELTPEAVERLRAAGLEKELPYSVLSPFRAADGCGLWSRYPADSLPPFQARFQAPGAVVRTPTREVVVRVLHPFPANLFDGGGPYRQDYAGITRQIRQLDAMAPTILAGDFNASVDNAEFRRLMGNRFRDASEVAGSGLQRTWSPKLGWPALLHLDHVLVDQHFDVLSTQVLDLPGSDHRAVLARLVLA
jgi:endonuclease/exonuclease/phosphatase (EEP) superfamily protein YafD